MEALAALGTCSYSNKISNLSSLCRMKNENLASKILSTVAESITRYPFDFQGARIITGQEEGAYGWITINYLLDKFIQVIIQHHPRR